MAKDSEQLWKLVRHFAVKQPSRGLTSRGLLPLGIELISD